LYFKRMYIINFVFIVFIISQVNVSYAENKPETLKAYFDSFATGEKKDNRDAWFIADKGYHVIGSVMSTTLVGQLSSRGFDATRKNSQIIGAAATFTLGVVKEIYDSRDTKNKFSWKDIATNGVGIIIGILLLGVD